MAFFIIFASLLLALSSVLGAPTPEIRLSPGSWANTNQGLVVHNTGYQGDGLYNAVFNDAGVATVNFTAIDQLNFTIPQAQPIGDHEHGVNRTGPGSNAPGFFRPPYFVNPDFQVTCDKNRCSNNEGDLQQAMGYLANNMGNAHQEPKRWTWVSSTREVMHTVF